jgi:hypothetical protein
MPNRQLPLCDTDFWWLRYVCGIALPIGLAVLGLYSFISRHSFAPFDGVHRGIHFVSVYGRQAIAMGLAYLGLALILFGNCYAQYHETMGFYYQRITAPGALMFVVGMVWCVWIYIAA